MNYTSIEQLHADQRVLMRDSGVIQGVYLIDVTEAQNNLQALRGIGRVKVTMEIQVYGCFRQVKLLNISDVYDLLSGVIALGEATFEEIASDE